MLKSPQNFPFNTQCLGIAERLSRVFRVLLLKKYFIFPTFFLYSPMKAMMEFRFAFNHFSRRNTWKCFKKKAAVTAFFLVRIRTRDWVYYEYRQILRDKAVRAIRDCQSCGYSVFQSFQDQTLVSLNEISVQSPICQDTVPHSQNRRYSKESL